MLRLIRPVARASHVRLHGAAPSNLMRHHVAYGDVAVSKHRSWASAPSQYQLVACFSTSEPKNDGKKDDLVDQLQAESKAEAKKEKDQRSKLTIVASALKSFGNSTKDVIMNPRATWQSIKHEINHYWMGTKLLWSEIKLTKSILGRLVEGHGMTRRERKQLVRTSTDIFRLVPFAIFVIVPFMELLLPFCLKLFPNMLPSTFQDSLKKEESMKKELQMRLAVAKFMQETLQEMAGKKADASNAEQGGKASGAIEILDFIDKAQHGQPVPTETVLRIARLFKDELTLDNIARPQLVSMCTYMGLQAYGSDTLLRFLLRNKLRKIKEDDRRILWEGVDSLNTLELKEACRERGMRSIGLTQFQLKHQLVDWLDLSTHQNVPIFLLIMSRALTLSHAHELPTEVLRSSLSSLDSDTINEVVLASVSGKEEDSIDIRKRKLESLKFQQEMIDEERAKAVANLPPVKEVSSVQAVPAKVVEISAKAAAAAAELPGGTSHTSALTVPVVADKVTIPVPSVAVEAAPKRELTLQEMQALFDLARGSSLQREKSELNIIQGTMESLPENKPEQSSGASPEHGQQSHSSDNASESISVDDQRTGRSMDRLRSVLTNMVKKLEVQIDTTEKVVGDKFNVLDKDGDGHLTAHELREAIVQLMRRDFSLQEADRLVDLLDDDKDGKVSLVELMHFIEQRKESLEIESMQKPASPDALPVEVAVGSRLIKETK